MFRNFVSAQILETQVRVPFLKIGNSLIGHAFTGKRLRNVRTTLNTDESVGSGRGVGNQQTGNEKKNVEFHVPGVEATAALARLHTTVPHRRLIHLLRRGCYSLLSGGSRGRGGGLLRRTGA